MFHVENIGLPLGFADEAECRTRIGFWVFLGIGEMALANDNKLRGLNHSDRIPNQYIVVLKEDVVSTCTSREFQAQQFADYVESFYDARVQRRFKNALSGLVIRANQSEL